MIKFPEFRTPEGCRDDLEDILGYMQAYQEYDVEMILYTAYIYDEEKDRYIRNVNLEQFQIIADHFKLHK
jgi:hypothetical protein|nr:MAG TPA: hypothetical protein [Caudoviricetes sp.]